MESFWDHPCLTLQTKIRKRSDGVLIIRCHTIESLFVSVGLFRRTIAGEQQLEPPTPAASGTVGNDLVERTQ